MTLNWRPVGPEPASTYWTRRAVLALVVLVVLWGLVALLTAGGGDDTLDASVEATPSPTSMRSPEPSTDPSATPEPSTSASPGPSASPSAEIPGCADADLKVTAESDQDSYKVGATPKLSLTVRNTSGKPCRRDLGQGAAELIVTSGKDRIWSSDDCAPGGDPGPVDLDPDEEDVNRVTWPRTRSRPGCAGDKAAAAPGTYVVSGRIGELRVQGESFRLEG